MLGLLREAKDFSLSDHFEELHVEGLVEELVGTVKATHHAIE
jgi:hypothetical protein